MQREGQRRGRFAVSHGPKGLLIQGRPRVALCFPLARELHMLWAAPAVTWWEMLPEQLLSMFPQGDETCQARQSARLLIQTRLPRESLSWS